MSARKKKYAGYTGHNITENTEMGLWRGYEGTIQKTRSSFNKHLETADYVQATVISTGVVNKTHSPCYHGYYYPLGETYVKQNHRCIIVDKDKEKLAV